MERLLWLERTCDFEKMMSIMDIVSYAAAKANLIHIFSAQAFTQHCQKKRHKGISDIRFSTSWVHISGKAESTSFFAWKKQCVDCNSYLQQNVRVQCSLNFKSGTYNVMKCIFIIFNVKKVTQHNNYICLLFWKCSFAYYEYIQLVRVD